MVKQMIEETTHEKKEGSMLLLSITTYVRCEVKFL